MANLVRTAKGKVIDLNQLFMDNQKTVALGNAKMNARGDILKNGKVVKTVEEQRKEYEEANERTNVSKTVPVSSSDKLDKILENEIQELKSSKPKNKSSKSSKEETVNTQSNFDNENEGLSLNDILN